MEGILYLIIAVLLLGVARMLTVCLHEFTHAVFALRYTKKEVIEVFIGSTGERKEGWHLRLGKRIHAYIQFTPWKPYCGICKYPQRTLAWQQEIKLLLSANIMSLGIFIGAAMVLSTTTHGFVGLLCTYFLLCSLVDLLTNLISKKTPFMLYDSTLQRTDIDQMHKTLTHHDLTLAQAWKELLKGKEEKALKKETEEVKPTRQESKTKPTVKGNRMSDN
jgi:hypothetical protein